MFFRINHTHKNLIQKQITQEFGRESSCVPLGEGTENQNFLMNHTSVLRVLFIDQNSPLYDSATAYLAREINFANALFEAQINPLHYKCFKNKQQLLDLPTDDGTLYFLQYDWIPGNFLTYTSRNIQQLAQMMGACHKTAQKLSQTSAIPDISVYDALPSSLHYRAFAYDPTLAETIDNYAFYWRIFQENTQLLSCYRRQQPNHLIHCDLHRKNILTTDHNMAIIDFGDTRLSVRAEDIGTCFWGMGLEIKNLEMFDSLTQDFWTAYPKVLSESEKVYCLRFALQRFLDIHLFYLKENLSSTPKMTYQTEKFSKEQAIIDHLIAVIAGRK